jgi:plastin-1
MRFHVISILKGLSKKSGGDITDNDIIKWANDTVAASGKSSRIESFKDPSLRTSIFLLDLLAAVRPGVVDFDLVTDGASDKVPPGYFLLARTTADPALLAGRHPECQIRHLHRA